MDSRRKRLLFRARHMGTAENDTLFGGFAEAVLSELSDSELDQFEALLAANDTDLFQWATGKQAAPAEHQTGVMRRLRAFVEAPR